MKKKPIQNRKPHNADKQIPDILAAQKQTLRKVCLDYLWSTVFLLTLALVGFIVGLCVEDAAHSKNILLIAVPLILCITLLFALISLRRFLIYIKLNKVTTLNEENRTVECKKVSFITYPTTRYYFVIICIVFTDENGEKYYAVTEGVSECSKKTLKDELLNSNVSLVCYKNSNFVKHYKVL
ncbi:MAG: hypothetical protein ACI4MH_00015 [Candidatus Coproplasma sp.]